MPWNIYQGFRVSITPIFNNAEKASLSMFVTVDSCFSRLQLLYLIR
jgi:hypothetical protein